MEKRSVAPAKSVAAKKRCVVFSTGREDKGSALFDPVLTEVRADVVAFHSALPGHFADVALRGLREVAEVVLLERRDRAPLRLGERRLRARRLVGNGVAREREDVVDRVGRVSEG